MADIEDMATKKYAGLPLWGWGAITAGIVVIFVWFRNRSAQSDLPVMNADVASVLGGMAAQTGGIPTGGGGGDFSQSEPQATQSDWLSDAVRTLSGNFGGGVNVTNALSKFMSGLPLTSNEQSIVDEAISKYGLPPGFSASTAAQAGQQSSENQYSFSDQINDLFGALAQQQQAQTQSLTDQWQAFMDQQSDATKQAVPSTQTVVPASNKKADAIAHAKSLAQSLNRNVQTAYGWVSPTGVVTSTDTRADIVNNARAMATAAGKPIHTAYGYITHNGAAFASYADAVADMAKTKATARKA